MFITKKYLNRRTVLRGAGAMIALPLLDAMIPAAHRAGQHRREAAREAGVRLLPAWRHHGEVDAGEGGHGLRAGARFSSRCKPFQKQLTIISGLGNRPGESQAVHAIVPATWLSCIIRSRGRNPTWRSRRTRSPPSTSARTHRCRRSRSPPRRSRRRRRVRSRLRLQLLRHDCLPHADHAAADGIQPAQAVPAPVRSWRQPGRAQGARRAARRASSTWCRRTLRRCSAHWALATARC